MSKKSKTKTDAIDWAKPALQQGVANTQDAYTASKPITDTVAAGLGGLFSHYLDRAKAGSPALQSANDSVAATARGAYLGGNPGAATYARLQTATDPSLGRLSTLGDGAFVGQGAGMDAMRGLLTRGTSPTADYYRKTLAGDFLNSNPHADFLVDDVANDVNGSFSLSGRYGSGAHQGVLARESGKIRAGLYNAERDRMNSVAGMADAYDLNDRAAVLSAANAYGDNTRADRAQQMGALGLLSDATARQNAGQLAAAQAGDAAYGDERQRMLAASAMAPQLSQVDFAGLAPLLALAQQYQQTPFNTVSDYNQNIGLLSEPYSVTKSKQYGLGNTLGTAAQIGGAIAGAAMGNPMALAGAGGGMGMPQFGSGAFTQGWSAATPMFQSSGLLSTDPWSYLGG